MNIYTLHLININSKNNLLPPITSMNVMYLQTFNKLYIGDIYINSYDKIICIPSRYSYLGKHNKYIISIGLNQLNNYLQQNKYIDTIVINKQIEKYIVNTLNCKVIYE